MDSAAAALVMRSADEWELAAVRLGRRDVEWCERPLLFVDDTCGALLVRQCRLSRESRCRPCATRRRRLLARLAIDGMHKHRGRYLYLLTLTAPGDPGHRGWVPGVVGDHGLCDCWQHAADGLGVWNRQSSRRWNHLRTVLRREYPGVEYFKATEVQTRGALHFHLIVASEVPLAPLVVWGLARRAGFGCRGFDLQPIQASDPKPARYVAKYVSKSADARECVPWEQVDYATGEVVSNPNPPYRTWSASRGFSLRLLDYRAAARRAVEARATASGGTCDGARRWRADSYVPMPLEPDPPPF